MGDEHARCKTILLVGHSKCAPWILTTSPMSRAGAPPSASLKSTGIVMNLMKRTKQTSVRNNYADSLLPRLDSSVVILCDESHKLKCRLPRPMAVVASHPVTDAALSPPQFPPPLPHPHRHAPATPYPSGLRDRPKVLHDLTRAFTPQMPADSQPTPWETQCLRDRPRGMRCFQVALLTR